MSKVIIFSRTFPTYHPKAGEPTYFVEKFLNSMHVIGQDYSMEGFPTDFIKDLDLNHLLNKYHTIRSGDRWKVGDKFSPRVWSGKPYQSKQIIIAPDIEIKKVFTLKIYGGKFFINNSAIHDNKTLDQLAFNDGLTKIDLFAWFKYPSYFSGQIICWNEKIDY